MTQKIKEVVSTLLKREFDVKELFTTIRGLVLVWSWGAHEYTNMVDKGLLFRVNGHHHKGWVLIALEWDDTFNVHLISTSGTIKKTFTMVYNDMLIETIDNAVEKIADYQY